MKGEFQIDNLITIATPALGEFGIPNWFGIRSHLNEIIRENAHLFFYNPVVQRTIGLSWCWRDAKRKSQYLKSNLILPLINNEIQHSRSNQFKSNFLKLKKYIIFGSDGDEIVDPWQSQFYGFFNESMKIVPMENQDFFRNDTFGLLTLFRTNRLIIHFEKDVFHLAWVARKDLIEKVIKYLD